VNERLCAWCGKSFHPRRTDQHFCCNAHTKYAWRKANPERWQASQQRAQYRWRYKQQASGLAWKGRKQAYNKKYYLSHREQVIERNKAYYREKKEQK